MTGSQTSPGSSVSTNPWQPVYDIMQGVSREAVLSRYGLRDQDLDKLIEDYKSSRRQMALADHLIVKRVGRNEPCPCGSGKKYKKCCLPHHEEARKALPKDELQQMEERAKRREKLQKDVEKGFGLLLEGAHEKARRHAERLLEAYPEDDRLHDIVVTACLTAGDYDAAFYRARTRWQVAVEEKDFFQENGYHKREGLERKELVHFYSPATWLEKFWIAQRARIYEKEFPRTGDGDLARLASKLRIANDVKRFPQRDAEGLEVRRRAMEAQLTQIREAGPAMIPYLLPQCYTFSWASLFVPDLLGSYDHEAVPRLLAELSMFRFPYFAQMCLKHLEAMGERAVSVISQVLSENAAFDELKVGLIMVLGAVETKESFDLLTRLTEHESPYVVNWVAQALGRHKNPEALPYLEKAKERLGALSKIEGAIKDILSQKQGAEG